MRMNDSEYGYKQAVAGQSLCRGLQVEIKELWKSQRVENACLSLSWETGRGMFFETDGPLKLQIEKQVKTRVMSRPLPIPLEGREAGR
jgi:hypothetical protein